MQSSWIVSIVKMLSTKEISTSRMGKEAVIDTTMNETLIRLTGSFLLEQAYAIASKEPYRVRVLQPTICPMRGLLILN